MVRAVMSMCPHLYYAVETQMDPFMALPSASALTGPGQHGLHDISSVSMLPSTTTTVSASTDPTSGVLGFWMDTWIWPSK